MLCSVDFGSIWLKGIGGWRSAYVELPMAGHEGHATVPILKKDIAMIKFIWRNLDTATLEEIMELSDNGTLRARVDQITWADRDPLRPKFTYDEEMRVRQAAVHLLLTRTDRKKK